MGTSRNAEREKIRRADADDAVKRYDDAVRARDARTAELRQLRRDRDAEKAKQAQTQSPSTIKPDT